MVNTPSAFVVSTSASQSVGVINGHQALAAPARQVIDEYLVVVREGRLACDQLVEARVSVVVVGDARGADADALVAVPVRWVGRRVRAVRRLQPHAVWSTGTHPTHKQQRQILLMSSRSRRRTGGLATPLRSPPAGAATVINVESIEPKLGQI